MITHEVGTFLSILSCGKHLLLLLIASSVCRLEFESVLSMGKERQGELQEEDKEPSGLHTCTPALRTQWAVHLYSSTQEEHKSEVSLDYTVRQSQRQRQNNQATKE